jgi:hypothetical protein
MAGLVPGLPDTPRMAGSAAGKPPPKGVAGREAKPGNPPPAATPPGPPAKVSSGWAPFLFFPLEGGRVLLVGTSIRAPQKGQIPFLPA